MRLIFVGTSAAGRGTETHLVSLARAMAEAGHNVIAVAHPDGYVARQLGAARIPVEPGIFRNALDVRGAGAVLRAARRLRPDWLVGSFGHEYWPLLALGRLTGTRVALFRHVNSPLKPLTRRFVPRLADRFIAVSAAMRTHLIEQGVDAARIQLLYNPLHLCQFRPDRELRADTRTALRLGDDEVLVGFVGLLDEAKGAFRLAEAFNSAMRIEPRLRALWVGQETAHARLVSAIAPELRDRHTVRGWVADVTPWYAAMDVVAIPSEWLEPFGRVSIEAQACGVPVLASRLGGLPETLEDGTSGRLLPPADVASWTAALVDIARMPAERRRQMGSAGARLVAQRFDARIICLQFAALLAESPFVISGNRDAATCP
jgi:glycosyltransferase involved in cell wall biosynthesis